jgi:hypothetical protein
MMSIWWACIATSGYCWAISRQRPSRQVQPLARAAARKLEGKLQETVRASAGKDTFLDHELTVGALEHHTAGRGVLALGVLAHDQIVDLPWLATRQRTTQAFEEPYRAQIDVLVELAAKLQKRAPQRHVVGHGIGPPHGAEVQRVHVLQLGLPIRRHHAAVLLVMLAAGPVDGRDVHLEFKARFRRLQNAKAFGHDFLADAVAGDGGDPQGAVGGDCGCGGSGWGAHPLIVLAEEDSRSRYNADPHPARWKLT